MILGRITGKVSTNHFKFQIDGDAKKFEYVQVMHGNNHYFLAQIMEIEKDTERAIASCNVLGYRNEEGLLRGLRTPTEPGTEVLKAEDDLIKEILGLEKKGGSAYIGTLDGKEKLKVHIDLNRLLTKHVVILAKSGSGKSFLAGDLIEEILEHRVPVVIIDPHGEYNTIKYPNPKHKDLMERFSITPKGYLQAVQEFSPDTESNPEAKKLKLSNKGITPGELIHLLPAKLSNSQTGILYSAIKNLGNNANFDELVFELETQEENSSKWTLINIIDYVRKLNLFSDSYTTMSELVQPDKVSIINLKGTSPELQEVVVYKLVNDLFRERKKGNIPPFFLLIEEAHNFVPERSFGEAKSSAIIRQVAAEGRKFGLGLGVISQRPSRLEKSVISQCSTQFILKVTNPNDLKAISHSVEGITAETEREIKNIPIGTALITGVLDLPIFVNVRPRRSKHGGEAVNIFTTPTEEPEGEIKEENFEEQVKEFEDVKGEMLPVIQPKITKEDLKLMSEKPLDIETTIIPCAMLKCNQGEDDFNILIDLSKAQIVNDMDEITGFSLLDLKLEDISPQQNRIFQVALKLGDFKPAELFAKSGVQFSELYDIITILSDKGYLEKYEDSYRISDSLKLFSNLQEAACFEKVDYARVEYDQKLDKKYNLEKIKEFLAKFVNVKEVKECWLIKYEH
jgi:DNA helicase HerA-like ATPase